MHPLVKLIKLRFKKDTKYIITAVGEIENINTCSVIDNKLVLHLDNHSIYHEHLLRKTQPFSIKQKVNVITLDYGINSYFIAALINAHKVNY